MHLSARRVKRGMLIAAVILVVVLIAVFVRAYRGAAPDVPGAAPNGPATSSLLPSPTPGTASGSDAGSARGVHALQIPRTLPPYTITPAENPGFVIAPIRKHRLVMTVTSAQSLPRLGYIAPTSPDHSYGDVKDPGGKRWTLRTTVTGKPYYAALFIQAGSTGAALPCPLSLAGVVPDTKSTAGPYGRQVCLA